ncbi:MAG: hypothetical protein ABIF84_01020 [Patescibacteria group bacterium]
MKLIMPAEPSQIAVANLKAAGEELKKVGPSVFKTTTKTTRIEPAKMLDEKPTEDQLPELAPQPVTSSLPIILGYQEQLSRELKVLEEAEEKAKKTLEKLARRVELLKGLQAESTEISDKLKKFEEQMTITKKDTNTFLE